MHPHIQTSIHQHIHASSHVHTSPVGVTAGLGGSIQCAHLPSALSPTPHPMLMQGSSCFCRPPPQALNLNHSASLVSPLTEKPKP
eukprot:363344-Chlamydomonas_euryale.AAC.5